MTLRILAYVDGYLPRLLGGAEVMLQTWLVDLQSRGHEVRVLTTDPHAPSDSSFEGVRVVRPSTDEEIAAQFNWSNLVITHLRVAADATNLGAQYGVPVVHLLHNPEALTVLGITGGALAVYNSHSLAASDAFDGPSKILYPPVDPSLYRTTRGDRITLINLGMWKGGNVFWRLVDRMPERQFLAKHGGHMRQIVPSVIPPNAELVADGYGPSDMREAVYGRTRILLMPSAFEPWGRTAIEAASSGIPVIAHPATGLSEALGDAGIYVDRDDTDGWVREIQKLDDPDHYRDRSQAVSARADELWRETERQLDALEPALLQAATLTPQANWLPNATVGA